MFDPELLDRAIREVAYQRMMAEIREWVIFTGTKEVHQILATYEQYVEDQGKQNE